MCAAQRRVAQEQMKVLKQLHMLAAVQAMREGLSPLHLIEKFMKWKAFFWSTHPMHLHSVSFASAQAFPSL